MAGVNWHPEGPQLEAVKGSPAATDTNVHVHVCVPLLFKIIYLFFTDT